MKIYGVRINPSFSIVSYWETKAAAQKQVDKLNENRYEAPSERPWHVVEIKVFK